MTSSIRARRVRPEAVALCWRAREALLDQALDWDTLPFLERQRVLLEFRVRTGKPVQEWLAILGRLERDLIAGPGRGVDPVPLDRLAAFYDHLSDLAGVHAGDTVWRVAELRDVDRRSMEIRRLADLLEPVQALSPG
jgi:hypothetical protein